MDNVVHLTPREHAILELIWRGLASKEIGPQLGITFKTVEAHRANMMRKMEADNTAQLLRRSLIEGRIALPKEKHGQPETL